MITILEINDIIRIPENKLYCWQEVLVEGIHQRMKHTIVRDTICCTTLKATAKCGQLKKESSRRFGVKVSYKFIQFKIMVGELLQGTISEFSDNGLTLSFQYCHDIFVPKTGHKLYGRDFDWRSKYKIGDIINFRISFIRFNDRKVNNDEELEKGEWFQIYGKIV